MEYVKMPKKTEVVQAPQKAIRIDIPIYRQEIIASTCPDGIMKYIKRVFKGDHALYDHVDEILHTTHGCYIELNDMTGQSIFLLMAPNIPTLCHEAIHAAWGILDKAGVKCEVENHEQLAYLAGHIVEVFTKKIKL
tara:strand:- start:4096 stop:4503 length:408 start_codon:yes stop_codon:yes gene_type:complete